MKSICGVLQMHESFSYKALRMGSPATVPGEHIMDKAADAIEIPTATRAHFAEAVKNTVCTHNGYR